MTFKFALLVIPMFASTFAAPAFAAPCQVIGQATTGPGDQPLVAQNTQGPGNQPVVSASANKPEGNRDPIVSAQNQAPPSNYQAAQNMSPPSNYRAAQNLSPPDNAAYKAAQNLSPAADCQ